MVDNRGRVMLNLSDGHIKLLREICDTLDCSESEAFIDGLKAYRRELVRDGRIMVETDVAVRLIRKVAVLMGNDDFDDETIEAAVGNGNLTST